MKYLIIFSLIFLPLVSNAQTFQNTFREGLIIEITPQIPSPNETVSAKVISNNYEDLSRANITWSINNIDKKREIGGTTFQFQAPAAGKKIELFVTVEKTNGAIFSNFINIQTANLDLIYEANTYVPPFYKGRSLFVTQSEITVAAMAEVFENGAKLPKNKVIYNWYYNDNYASNLSGIGKDSARFEGDILSRPFSVSVIVESLNPGIKSKNKILIKPVPSKILMYENNPIYGSLFEKALTGIFNFDREEVGITAVPYFFSTKDRTSKDIKYSWSENGKKIGDETFGSFINYQNPNRKLNGISFLRVEVENLSRFMQSGDNSFKINVIGDGQSDTIKPNETTSF